LEIRKRNTFQGKGYYPPKEKKRKKTSLGSTRKRGGERGVFGIRSGGFRKVLVWTPSEKEKMSFFLLGKRGGASSNWSAEETVKGGLWEGTVSSPIS